MGVRPTTADEGLSWRWIPVQRLGKCAPRILQVIFTIKWSADADHNASNLFILLYRSAFVRDEEEVGREEGQIALQAAQRITSIADEMLSQDLVRYASTHLQVHLDPNM